MADDPVVDIEREAIPGDAAERGLEQLPRADAVEQLEEDDAEEELIAVGGEVIAVDDSTDEVLAYAIRSAVGVGELVVSKDWVKRPRGWHTQQPVVKDLLAFCCEVPVAFIEGRGPQARTLREEDRRLRCRRSAPQGFPGSSSLGGG